MNKPTNHQPADHMKKIRLKYKPEADQEPIFGTLCWHMLCAYNDGWLNAHAMWYRCVRLYK